MQIFNHCIHDCLIVSVCSFTSFYCFYGNEMYKSRSLLLVDVFRVLLKLFFLPPPPPPRCLWNSISVMTDIKNHQARGKSSLPSFHRTLNPSSQLSFFIFKFSLLFPPVIQKSKKKKSIFAA